VGKFVTEGLGWVSIKLQFLKKCFYPSNDFLKKGKEILGVRFALFNFKGFEPLITYL
jgi:hypothetical protein